MWLDCDPGHDDAVALMVACSHPAIDLLGVSTVACNQTVEKTTVNAISVLHACGYGDVPVAQGSPKPLMRPCLPRAALAIPDAIRRVHAEGRGPLQLVCTGALTNAALALMLFPELASPEHVKITLMGGAMGIGNTGPVQEFNIQSDPEAANVVFESGVPVVMVPIEARQILPFSSRLRVQCFHTGRTQGYWAQHIPHVVTHTVLATPDVRKRVAALHSAFGRTAVDLLDFFAATYREVFQFRDPPVHDPVAVVYVLHPELFQAELMRVDVETASPLSSGQTVCDVWHQSDKPKNVTVVQSVDVGACWDVILEAIARCDVSSTLNK